MISSSAAVLAELRADPEAFGPLSGRALLAVDAASADAARVGELVQRLPCVCVAVADDPQATPGEITTAGFDILLTGRPHAPRPWVSVPGAVTATVDLLFAAAAANPFAAAALVQLLRSSNGLDIRDAVVAESFAYSALQAGPEHARWLARRRHSARPVRGTDRRHAAPARAGTVQRPRPGEREAPAVRSTPTVLLAREGSTLVVTLNRPAVHNAVNTAVRDGLVGAFRLAGLDDDVTEIRLAGAGPSFSSGGDLVEFGTLPGPFEGHAVRTTRSIPLSLLATGLPATAWVHGLCIGAGAELPAFCGRVVAAPDATFRLPETAMGLVPGAGGTASLPRRIGRERATYLILSGQPIGAEQALAWGLVDEIAAGPGAPPAGG
ncbi:enoyl-CoA hydratase/isomerase family protein [Frankia sp. AgKG'84/4]|uniref:enoyl-CoA hydratase/isomerase family protein n=1 Tax=Frankia sp. AgKG'84/4 TaxID=573490 RepID=UPI00200BEB5E|nr:enoyl-CoA hydratase/isomerase family protein [Frankia sp. AgKG'84/4]MCL9792838.1 enoyl-CoA hydratase/isomerase family protein [Frankia sp. AgKG'84/4]